MADFVELHQQDGQTRADFQAEVTKKIDEGYHVVAGYADPQGEHSWVQVEKRNKSPSEGRKSTLISE